MATHFPIKGENHENSISYVNYQPRVTEEHLVAEEDVHKIVPAIMLLTGEIRTPSTAGTRSSSPR